MEQCGDPCFAQGLLGRGVLLLPTGDTLCAPADALVDFSFFTGHAVGLETENGLEFLLHMGLETHRLGEKGFQTHVRTGDRVKCGDPLLSFDAALLREEGYALCTPFVFCNLGSRDLTVLKTGSVRAGETLVAVS